jgi:uncharacterized protein YecE (DUF72 family)
MLFLGKAKKRRMREGSARIHCGPCGWNHLERNSRQHPLEFVSENFDAVEISETFREFPRQELTRVWLRKVMKNPDFQFTAKLHRTFTHDRTLDAAEVARFKEGLWPLLRAGRLGCLLMQFPWSFRYTRENREHLISLRRTFHEFPLAAEMRHASWMLDEAVGTFIDYRIGFCNIDQPSYTRAMPPTAFLTAATGYVRLHGRNSFNWYQDDRAPQQMHRYDYLYSQTELAEWKARIDRIAGFASRTFVILNNDAGGKAIVNGLQLRSMLRGGDGQDIPAELLRKYPAQAPGSLFSTYPGRAVA